ncbi:MAG: helix-turn-helix domain-containing protein [Chloroflexi bacterium]|nr:helix-turn-helix domain-containing protein [Chloroflexota bacterium]
MVGTRDRELLEQLAMVVRTSRRTRRWTQQRLADELGVSQSQIARLERAQLARVPLITASRTLEILGGRLDARFIGPTAGAPSQRDLAHARCVAYVARRLVAAGFEVATEVEVGDGRWVAFADILAFHPRERVLLVIEVKTEIHDLGDLDRQVGVAARGAWLAAQVRGWRPRLALSTLVVLATEANDRRLADNRGYLDRRYPIRARQLRAIVTGAPNDIPRGARCLAMVDPRTRRHDWLLPTWIDGRRAAVPYRDRSDYLTRAPSRRLESRP